jgi:transposase-like protein
MDTKAEGTARLTSTTDSKDAHRGQCGSVILDEKDVQTRDMEQKRDELMHLLGAVTNGQKEILDATIEGIEEVKAGQQAMQQSLAQIQDVSKVRDGAPDTSL